MVVTFRLYRGRGWTEPQLFCLRSTLAMLKALSRSHLIQQGRPQRRQKTHQRTARRYMARRAHEIGRKRRWGL